jgi:hypothetical protein
MTWPPAEILGNAPFPILDDGGLKTPFRASFKKRLSAAPYPRSRQSLAICLNPRLS